MLCAMCFGSVRDLSGVLAGVERKWRGKKKAMKGNGMKNRVMEEKDMEEKDREKGMQRRRHGVKPKGSHTLTCPVLPRPPPTSSSRSGRSCTMFEMDIFWDEIAGQAEADAVTTWLLFVALREVSKSRETALVKGEKHLCVV